MSENRSRSPLLPLFGVVILAGLALWMFVSGCGKDPEVPPAAPKPKKPSQLAFETWEKPAAALILSGEQHGYIEPCGCSETQSGGLARRADLIHRLNKKGWTTAGLDLGGSLRLAKAEAGEELRGGQLLNTLQSKLKFDTQLAVQQDLRYATVALGYEELLFGGGRLLNNYQSRLSPDSGQEKPRLMAANAVIYESPQLGPNRSQVVKIGEIHVGVTAIVGEDIKRKLFGGDSSSVELQLKSPAEVLPEMVKSLEAANTDFNVLLSHARFAETEDLLKQFPQFHIAMCLGGEEGRDEPQQVGDSLVLQVGHKGKHVGVLAYYPDADPKFQFELVELDNEHFTNEPSVEPHLLNYQERLKKHSDPATHSGADYLYSNENMTSGSHPQAGEFVGAAKCGECHTKAYAKWKDSKHAHAYDSLKTGRKGQYSQPIPRIHDPECLSCHVTGWSPQGVFPYDSGFLPEVIANHENSPNRYALLQGQQCENCHGPGSDHVALEMQVKHDPQSVGVEMLRLSRRKMVLSKVDAKDNLCIKCHDYENSPNFQFEEYWKKIEHPWRN